MRFSIFALLTIEKLSTSLGVVFLSCNNSYHTFLSFANPEAAWTWKLDVQLINSSYLCFGGAGMRISAGLAGGCSAGLGSFSVVPAAGGCSGSSFGFSSASGSVSWVVSAWFSVAGGCRLCGLGILLCCPCSRGLLRLFFWLLLCLWLRFLSCICLVFGCWGCRLCGLRLRLGWRSALWCGLLLLFRSFCYQL